MIRSSRWQKDDNFTDAESKREKSTDIRRCIMDAKESYLTNLWVLKAFATLNPATTWLSRLWSHHLPLMKSVFK